MFLRDNVRNKNRWKYAEALMFSGINKHFIWMRVDKQRAWISSSTMLRTESGSEMRASPVVSNV